MSKNAKISRVPALQLHEYCLPYRKFEFRGVSFKFQHDATRKFEFFA
jgi:hypothetical protein